MIMTKQLYLWTGAVLVGVGTVLFLLLGAHLGGFVVQPVVDAGINGMGLYLGATAGSAMIGWGAILVRSAPHSELHGAVGFGTGLGFLALALMRFWVVLSGHDDFTTVAALLPVEVIVFMILAFMFFQASFGFWPRLSDAFFSLNAAPGWVQIWVWFFLLPVNMASFFFYGFTKHPLPGWVALGFMFVVLCNMAIALYERGISKITALPHLIPWIPLQLYTGYWLFVWGGLTPALATFAWAYFIIIGISNLFDAYDTFRWFRGERAIMKKEELPA